MFIEADPKSRVLDPPEAITSQEDVPATVACTHGYVDGARQTLAEGIVALPASSLKITLPQLLEEVLERDVRRPKNAAKRAAPDLRV